MDDCMTDLLSGLPAGGEERRLALALDPERMPRHIAIIMDGNGRWATRRRMPRVAGHRAGVTAVREITETCARLHLDALTLYAFSLENWKRPRTEVDTLWVLLRQYLRQEYGTLMENNVRLHAFGRLEALPYVVRRSLEETIAATAANTGLRLNLAINYGGRAEIVDAINAWIRDSGGGPITEQDLAARLYTSGLPDPDLLIRTSGEMRVSNFLLWQIAYAELHVTDTLWPDFRRVHLLRAIVDYQSRDRRFGGLGSDRVPEDRSPALEVAAPVR
jgi:undecaprenyl diphosphate synthase